MSPSSSPPSTTCPPAGSVEDWEGALLKAKDATTEVDNKLTDLLRWLELQEDYLKNCGPVGDNYDELVAQLEEHKVGVFMA